jgi:hypothetical protein
VDSVHETQANLCFVSKSTKGFSLCSIQFNAYDVAMNYR